MLKMHDIFIYACAEHACVYLPQNVVMILQSNHHANLAKSIV